MSRPVERVARSKVTAAIALLLLGAASGSWARPRYDLRLEVDPAAREARGALGVTLDASEAGSKVDLWLFPARLARPSPAIVDESFHWIYPGSFDPSGLTVRRAAQGGRPVATAILDDDVGGPGTVLRAGPLDAGPGGASLDLEFAARLPRRHGGFGCVGGGCTLAGGVHPLLVALDGAGDRRRLPPPNVDQRIEVKAPAGYEVMIDGERVGAAERRGLPYSVIQVAPRGRWTTRTIEHRAVRVEYTHGQGAPPGEGGAQAMPYLGEEGPDLVLGALRDLLDLLHEEGLALPPGTTLRLAEAPLRMEIAVAHPGVVLVSDQAYRILPADRFRKFHSFQLVRAVANHLLMRFLAESEDRSDLSWSTDIAASWLVNAFTIREHRRQEFAHDLLRWAAFIPTIDQILYAPQIPFASAYFNTLDDPDPTRDDVLRFNHDRPRGKVVFEKLRDLLGDEAVRRIAGRQWRGTPVREAIEAEERGLFERRVAQWLGPYPAVDYRLALAGPEEDRRRLPCGAATPRLASPGASRWYCLRLSKEGAAPPVEPVEVRLTEAGGRAHDLRWDGEGREVTWLVGLDRRLRGAQLDPRRRLVERIDGGNDDPRLGNRQPGPVKLIYNNLGGLLSLQTLSLDLSLDFSLRRVHDLKNEVRLVLYRSPVAQVGLLATYLRSFGHKATPARLAGTLSAGLRVARLEPGFGRAAGVEVPGTLLSASLGLGYNDRRYLWYPRREWSGALSLSYALSAMDDGRLFQQATASARGERIQPLAADHGLAFEVEVAATFGDLRAPSQMLAAGAPAWLRGYEPDELLGRLRVIARAEYRHVFTSNLNVDFLHLLHLRGVGGGLFAEAGLITGCGTYAPTADDLFADVGYSLRLLADWFGVSQTVFHVDVAVPLVRRARSCLDVAARDPATRSPVGVFVYFGPVW